MVNDCTLDAAPDREKKYWSYNKIDIYIKHHPVMTKKKKQKKRCAFDGCKKKLTIVDLAIVCRCHRCFCPMHRSCPSHNCTIAAPPTVMTTTPTAQFKKIEVI